MYHLILTSLILSLLSSSQIIANQQSVSTEKAIKISDDLIPLLDLLLEKGFKVKFQNPPKTGVYVYFTLKAKLFGLHLFHSNWELVAILFFMRQRMQRKVVHMVH